MGTDIHMWLEERRDWAGESAWRMLMGESACYGYRHYPAFAVLAGVRNHYNLKPIAEPRGIPEDLSPEVQAILDRDGIAHTPSWLLLSEVLDHDWSQAMAHSGHVQLWAYKMWKQTGQLWPPSWCNGAYGQSVRHIQEDEMRKLASDLPDFTAAEISAAKKAAFKFEMEFMKSHPKLAHIYCVANWQTTHEEACEGFVKWARGLIKPMEDDQTDMWMLKSDGVRLVFYFDS